MSGFSNLLNIDLEYNGFTQNPLDSPHEIGCLSVDADQTVRYDRSQMKYYVPRVGRNVSLDLNVGYEDTIRESFDLHDKMKLLLEWLQYKHFEPLHRSEVDFVCNRGTLQKLLCTPFCTGSFDYWIICACRLDDVIYFEAVDTDDKLRREEEATEQDRRMQAWGYKFEQYMTADEPGGVPDVSSNTHEIEQFCIILNNRIGSFNLLMRAEVDGVSPSRRARPGRGNTACYVEMKTSKMVPNFKTSYQFKKFKSAKWWAQSMIIGIENNIIGLRDDGGIVRTIEELRTSVLPQMSQGMWDPQVCFNFCNNFLKYLYNKLDQNDHRIVYKFEYSGGPRVSVTRLRNPGERYQVLPDWYVASYRRDRAMYRR